MFGRIPGCTIRGAPRRGGRAWRASDTMRSILLFLCAGWVVVGIVAVAAFAFSMLQWGFRGVLLLNALVSFAAAGTLALLCGAVAKLGWPAAAGSVPGLELSEEDLPVVRRTRLDQIVRFHRAGKNDVAWNRLAGLSPGDLEAAVAILARSPELADLAQQAAAARRAAGGA